MISFKSVGHFFASVVQKVLAAESKVEAVVNQVESAEPVVEAVTAKIPKYGPLAVPIEKVGFALLGEALAVYKALGTAAEAKFADLGFDETVIATITAVASDPAVVAATKLL